YQAKEREKQAQHQAQQQQTQRQQRISASKARFDAAEAAEPGFYTTLDRRILAATPLELLPPDQAPQAIHVIAEEIMLSERGPELMAHLSANPSVLDRL